MEEQSSEDDTPVEDTSSESDGLPLEEENDFSYIFRSEFFEYN